MTISCRSLPCAVLLLLICVSSACAQREVRIGVLGLFHPRELVLEQGSSAVLSIVANETSLPGSRGLPRVINGEPGHRQLVFRAVGDQVVADAVSASSWTATSRGGKATSLRLIVPDKIRRIYFGQLTIRAHHGELLATITMDLETAVASIVASEMEESTPLEALKAQAVTTRSFLVAGPRHLQFDFCDTTHCQFLKSPPSAASRIALAVQATEGLILTYQGKPLRAMYSSRCGGRAHSLHDIGMDAGDDYPYFAVMCDWCLHHPITWHSKIDPGGAEPKSRNEGQRILQARQWGWSAMPGTDFTATREGSAWLLEGHGIGHGVGLCQSGAAGMAAASKNFREILSYYYPNTSLAFQPKIS